MQVNWDTSTDTSSEYEFVVLAHMDDNDKIYAVDDLFVVKSGTDMATKCNSADRETNGCRSTFESQKLLFCDSLMTAATSDWSQDTRNFGFPGGN